jgi:ABC-type lipoprotein export system ATPase subunit
VLRALVHNPRIVFADEPLSNLDPLNARLTLDLLLRWKKDGLGTNDNNGRCLVFVTHDVHLSWQHADRFAILRDGRLDGGQVLSRADLAPCGGEDEIRRRMGCAAEEDEVPA